MNELIRIQQEIARMSSRMKKTSIRNKKLTDDTDFLLKKVAASLH